MGNGIRPEEPITRMASLSSLLTTRRKVARTRSSVQKGSSMLNIGMSDLSAAMSNAVLLDDVNALGFAP
jgi:hypothetical protein